MRFAFRPLRDTDLPLLHAWLNRPHVAEWWDGPLTLGEVRVEFGGHIRSPLVRPQLAHLDGAPVAYVQSYRAMGHGGGWWPDEDDPGVHGIDLFLADAAGLGRGVGAAMVTQLAAELFREPAVTRLQIDPDPENLRAIRCYAKAGFRPQGEITTPDGPALLMTLERPADQSSSSRPSRRTQR
jgi:RimJ/RimL family protein N-acetyltransferase